MTASVKIRLSLSDLPSFDASPVFCCLDTDVEAGLVRFSDTYVRASVALRFLQNEGASAEHLHVHPEEEEQMRAGYLRAALMEFVGMEDSLPADLRRLGMYGPALRIWDTGNAMLILLRELRHIHVHVAQTTFARREQAAIFRGMGKELETTVTVRTIPKSDLEQLFHRRQAKHFEARELRAAIDWLHSAQNRWGIHDVVQAAINAYGRLIISRYCAPARHNDALN